MVFEFGWEEESIAYGLRSCARQVMSKVCMFCVVIHMDSSWMVWMILLFTWHIEAGLMILSSALALRSLSQSLAVRLYDASNDKRNRIQLNAYTDNTIQSKREKWKID